MQADTWEKLNGTGWGEEVLSESANPSTTFGGPPPFRQGRLFLDNIRHIHIV